MISPISTKRPLPGDWLFLPDMLYLDVENEAYLHSHSIKWNASFSMSYPEKTLNALKKVSSLLKDPPCVVK